MRIGSPRGFALVMVLLVVSLISLAVLHATHQAVLSLRDVSQGRRQQAQRYAAYAGLQKALSLLQADSNWQAGIINERLPNRSDASYSVTVVNNAGGLGPRQAPDGTTVPAGTVYLLSVGHCQGSSGSRFSALARRQGSGADLATDGEIDLDGFVRVRGFDSGTGTPMPAQLRSNGTGLNTVELENFSSLDGDLAVGPGADLSDAVKVDRFCRVTGTVSAASAPTSIPVRRPPMRAGGRDVEIGRRSGRGGSAATLSPGAYGDVDVEAGLLVLEPGVYVVQRLRLETATVVCNGPVELYVEDDCRVEQWSSLNDTGVPQDLKLYAAPGCEIEVEEFSSLRAVAVGQGSRLEVEHGASFYGVFSGERLRARDFASLFHDRAASGASAGTSGSWKLTAVGQGG